MKFKKRILTEETGLPKGNKKTFTKNKKQKVVVSEDQLQRLLKRINEKEAKIPMDVTNPPPPPLAEPFPNSLHLKVLATSESEPSIAPENVGK